jgi:hypothetical protein
MEGKNKVEIMLDNVKSYVETRFDIVVLNIQDRLSDVLSSVASILVLSILAVFVIFFLSVGAAWWIGQELNNSSIGFFYVAAFYFVVAVIIFACRDKWIKLPIINSLLKKINIHETD